MESVKGVSSMLSVCHKTVITDNTDERCEGELFCDETMILEADNGCRNLDGHELIEDMMTAIEMKDEARFQCQLQRISMCKTNKKYFKQESGSLMATAVLCDSENAVKHLIRAGAQRSNLNSYGDTHILMAIRHNKMSVLKSLAELKQDINSKNKLGHFPLFLAAELNRADVVKLLIKAGANVNTKMGRVKMISEDYLKPHRVSAPGDSVALLIVRRMVYEKSRAYSETDKDIYGTCREMLFAILDEKSFNFAKYSHSILDEMILKKIDDEDIYKRLLQDDYKIKQSDPYHYLCLINTKICVLLLEHLKKHQPNVDILCKQSDGSFTALVVACGQLNVDAVEWLLLNGADPNSQTINSIYGFNLITFFNNQFMSGGRYSTLLTPMYFAVSQRCFSNGVADKLCKIIKLLIRYGADVNARTSKGVTVLNSAVTAMAGEPTLSAEAISVIHLLLQAGANPDFCFVHESYQAKVKITLDCCTEKASKGIVEMMMEMSFSLGRETGLPISEIVHRFRHLRHMISDEIINRCFCQPRTLVSHCRKVILARCKACHLLETEKNFSMLPVKVQDYLSLKDLLDYTK